MALIYVFGVFAAVVVLITLARVVHIRRVKHRLTRQLARQACLDAGCPEFAEPRRRRYENWREGIRMWWDGWKKV